LEGVDLWVKRVRRGSNARSLVFVPCVNFWSDRRNTIRIFNITHEEGALAWDNFSMGVPIYYKPIIGLALNLSYLLLSLWLLFFKFSTYGHLNLTLSCLIVSSPIPAGRVVKEGEDSN
jgi:hypothetical protein